MSRLGKYMIDLDKDIKYRQIRYKDYKSGIINKIRLKKLSELKEDKRLCKILNLAILDLKDIITPPKDK